MGLLFMGWGSCCEIVRFAVGWFGRQRGRWVAVEAQTAQMQREALRGYALVRLSRFAAGEWDRRLVTCD